MGFIEETGVAQHYRDARILPIYEGTNGIQALDLIGRKTVRSKGQAMAELIEDMHMLATSANAHSVLSAERQARFDQAVACLEEATQVVLNRGEEDQFVGAVAFDYLMLSSIVTAGWLMVKSAIAAEEHCGEQDSFAENKRAITNFFMDHILPRCSGHLIALRSGEEAVMALPESEF
jgi:hypothetical protein